MKNVLIVDDEESFVTSLAAGLVKYSADFLILTATNGRKAVQVLESTNVDLVVTDLRMPEMDGFELLAYMSTSFPSVPTIVMSAYGTPHIKETLETMGTLKFLEKPVDFQELAQAILDGLKQDTKTGSVTGISLPSFLQLIEMEEKTCLLEIHVEEEGKEGFFYFNKGTLYDAICNGEKGEAAALEMIAWDKVEIRFKALPKKKIKRRIAAELMSLLMEGMRLKDESESTDTAQFHESNNSILELKEEDLILEPDRSMEGAPPFSAESTEELDWEHSLEAEDLVPDESQLDEEVTPSEGVAGDVEASLDEAIPLDEEAPFIGDGPDEQKSSTQYLNEILEIPGISAVIAVGRDGFVIESAGALGSIDMDLVGASVAMVLSGAERVGTELELSEFETLTLESDDALIMCTPVGEALLAILAPDSKGLGMIRLQLRKLIPELAQMF